MSLLREINMASYDSVGGIVVSIAAFQAVDPGSIPGQRKDFLSEFEISHSKYHNT